MHALIVLGGDAPAKDLLESCMRQADLTLAADSGLTAFDTAGLMPDMLIGDMDSVAPDVLARYEGKLPEHRLNCIKDDTDGVDALDVAIGRGADEITLLGALGFGSKIVITGDITQIDLPRDKVSGLKDAIRVLDGVEDIAICRLSASDVVRHALVQRIVAAYDQYEKNKLPAVGGGKKFKRKPL